MTLLGLRLMAAGVLLSTVSFGMFGMLAWSNRSEAGRRELSGWRWWPSFGLPAPEHYSGEGLRYARLSHWSLLLAVALGIAVAFTLPEFMNSPAP